MAALGTLAQGFEERSDRHQTLPAARGGVQDLGM